MQRAAGGPESVGRSAAVSLLDWYKLDKEVLLVMERPEPCLDLLTYLNDRPLEEAKAKVLKPTGASFCVSGWRSLEAWLSLNVVSFSEDLLLFSLVHAKDQPSNMLPIWAPLSHPPFIDGF